MRRGLLRAVPDLLGPRERRPREAAACRDHSRTDVERMRAGEGQREIGERDRTTRKLKARLDSARMGLLWSGEGKPSPFARRGVLFPAGSLDSKTRATRVSLTA